jgi:hypothetical protein
VYQGDAVPSGVIADTLFAKGQSPKGLLATIAALIRTSEFIPSGTPSLFPLGSSPKMRHRAETSAEISAGVPTGGQIRRVTETYKPSSALGEKTKAPQTQLSRGTLVEQPSPEVCSQPSYVPIWTVGMAPTCYGARVALQPPLQEETILNLGEFHGCGAFFVVVRHAIDPSAYGIAPHQPSIVVLQSFRRRTHILHSRIEPQVVAIWIEDDWHAVVDG